MNMNVPARIISSSTSLYQKPILMKALSAVKFGLSRLLAKEKDGANGWGLNFQRKFICFKTLQATIWVRCLLM